jgi:hypothetical protein
MRFAKIMTAHIASGVRRLASCVHSLIEARRRRIEEDKKFYRELRAYCRANNISPVCEDDWRTVAHDTEVGCTANGTARQG